MSYGGCISGDCAGALYGSGVHLLYVYWHLYVNRRRSETQHSAVASLFPAFNQIAASIDPLQPFFFSQSLIYKDLIPNPISYWFSEVCADVWNDFWNSRTKCDESFSSGIDPMQSSFLFPFLISVFQAEYLPIFFFAFDCIQVEFQWKHLSNHAPTAFDRFYIRCGR